MWTRTALALLCQGIRFSVFFFFVVSGALAQTLVGKVVKVQDGDTLTVLVNKAQIRVRLDAIDAPESGQAFGKRSRESLAELCAAKLAHIEDRGRDRYGRTIGHVTCADADANSEQVRRGMAWVFVRYAPKGSPLYVLEKDARLRAVGLWADPRPVAPWEWRDLRRNANRQTDNEVGKEA